jgi:tetratricopeptide (TPR) repeat protein
VGTPSTEDQEALAATVTAARRAVRDASEDDRASEEGNLAKALNKLGRSLRALDRRDEAVECFAEAERLMGSLPDFEERRLLVQSSLVAGLFMLDRYEEVVETADRMLTTATGADDLRLVAPMLTLRSLALTELQRWEDARAAGRKTADISGPDSPVWDQGYFVVGRYTEAIGARELGQHELALALIDDAIAVASPGSERYVPLARMLVVRGGLLEVAGKRGDARLAYREAVTVARESAAEASREWGAMGRARLVALRLHLPPPKSIAVIEASRRKGRLRRPVERT